MRKALLAVLCLWLFAPFPAQSQDVVLLAHRATYELRLEGRAPGGGIEAAYGLLAIDMADGCDSWDVRQAIALTLVRDESRITTVSEFDSQEAKDGGWYRFEDDTSHVPGGREVTAGQASTSPDRAGRVHVNQPETAEVGLPAGTLFPTAHVVAVLRGAMAGERVMSHVLYDGTDGTLIYDVTTAVGRGESDDGSGLRVWPVRLAYFVHGSLGELPELEISARLREDGVAQGLTFDYGGFVLGAVLQSLEPLPPPEC